MAKDRLLRLFQSAHVPFFEALQPQHVSSLAQLCEILVAEPNQVIFKQGDEGDAFYIVLNGTLDVSCTNAVVGWVGGMSAGQIRVCSRRERWQAQCFSAFLFTPFFSPRIVALVFVD